MLTHKIYASPNVEAKQVRLFFSIDLYRIPFRNHHQVPGSALLPVSIKSQDRVFIPRYLGSVNYFCNTIFLLTAWFSARIW